MGTILQSIRSIGKYLGINKEQYRAKNLNDFLLDLACCDRLHHSNAT